MGEINYLRITKNGDRFVPLRTAWSRFSIIFLRQIHKKIINYFAILNGGTGLCRAVSCAGLEARTN